MKNRDAMLLYRGLTDPQFRKIVGTLTFNIAIATGRQRLGLVVTAFEEGRQCAAEKIKRWDRAKKTMREATDEHAREAAGKELADATPDYQKYSAELDAWLAQECAVELPKLIEKDIPENLANGDLDTILPFISR